MSKMIAKWEAHHTRLKRHGLESLAEVIVVMIGGLEKELEKIEETLRSKLT